MITLKLSIPQFQGGILLLFLLKVLSLVALSENCVLSPTGHFWGTAMLVRHLVTWEYPVGWNPPGYGHNLAKTN